MIDNENLDEAVRGLIMEIMLVLHKNGVSTVHVGGLMRLIGVEDKTAAKHDEEVMEISDGFARYLETVVDKVVDDQYKPPTIH